MLEQFNSYHIGLLLGTVGVIIVLCVIFGVFLRHKRRLTWWVIMGLLIFCFFLHFARLLVLPKDREFPFAYSYITPMSVCAVSAMVFPFFFLSKKKILRDYMFYIGVLTGFLALITPMTAIDKPAFSFDVIRFFMLHGIICCAPLLMVITGHHKLSWRRVWQPAFVLAAVLCVIAVNELVLFASGILGPGYDLHTLITGQYIGRNGAMIFGPPHDAGSVSFYVKIFTSLCPSVFKHALFDIPALGLYAGDTIYWPIVWLIIPGVIFFTVVSFLMSMPFEAKNFWRDVKWLYYTLTQQIDKRNAMPPKKVGKLKS